MFVWKLGVFIVFVFQMPGLTYGWRRRRAASCDFGTYKHEGNTCCLCPTGFRVLRDCTSKNITKCEQCDEGTYLDYNNNDYQCRPCKICDPNAKMKVNEKCSRSSNTVCGCEKDYFCDKGDDCRTCYPCETCAHGVKEPCTETINTVCHDAKDSTGITVAAILVPLILIFVAAGIIIIWGKKMFCFQDRRRTDPPKQREETLSLIDLSPHLSKIADNLRWKTMKRVAQHSGMTTKDIEEQELNHPHDVREQTFGLLEAWSQKQGLNGAYGTLIKTLQEIGEKTTADQIRNIVEPPSQP